MSAENENNLDGINDIASLKEAFGIFNETTSKLQESHDKLTQQVAMLSSELARKNNEITSLSQLLMSVLTSITDGVIALNSDKTIRWANKSGEEILNVSNLSGKKLSSLPVGTESLKEILSMASDEISLGISQECEINSKLNELKTISMTIAELQEENKSSGIVATFRDMTGEIELRKNLESHKRLAALGEMAAGVAHEIRNPLGAIQLYAGLIARGLSENSKEHSLAKKIVASVLSLERVVSDMLVFTREMKAHIIEYSPEICLHAAIELSVLDPNIEVKLDTKDAVKATALDPDLIQRALLNLIRNAAKAMDNDGVLSLYIGENADDIFFQISDTGSGVPLDLRDTIFNPFYTTHAEGTGLGLSIAHRIAEAHNGRIEISDAKKGGAMFTLFVNKRKANN